MRRAVQSVERLQGAAFAVDRHVAHAAAGFLSRSAAQHLVVGEQRAVEQHGVGAREALAHGGRHRRGARHEDEPRALALQLDADIGGALGAGLGIVAFEIERQLAGHHEQARLDVSRQHETLARIDRAPRHRRERAEHGIGGDRGVARRRRVEA